MSAISDKYDSLGGASGFLGAATAAESANADGLGRRQDFAHGVIYWHPDLGAYEIHGDILRRWQTLGNQVSPLGYPMTDELTTPDGRGRYNHFQGGSIYWHPRTGAHDVRGRIRERWAQLRWEQGFLGYPIAGQQLETRGRDTFEVSRFQFGRIERNLANDHVQTFRTPSEYSPNYEIPIAAVQVSDTNGARPALVTATDIQQWLAHANQVFATAGIRFEFNGQLLDLKSTDVNNLMGDSDPFWIISRDALNQLAAQQKALLIAFRHGPGAYPTGRGFSWWDYDFVVMPVFDVRNLGLLAHELGHYFGLPHTHGPGFQTVDEAANFFLSRHNNPNVFDGDGWLLDQHGRSLISDTAPDPFIRALENDPSRTSVNLAGTPFALARGNAMSYWPTAVPPTFSHDQISRIRAVLVERIGRVPLNVTLITHPLRIQVTPYPVPLNRAVSLVVTATENDTGLPVTGQVMIDGQAVGSTGVAFIHTFRAKRKRISVKPPEWEITYPSGMLSATGFQDAEIDFGFPA